MKTVVLELEPGQEFPETVVQAYLPHYKSWLTLTYADGLDNSYANAYSIAEKYQVRTRIVVAEQEPTESAIERNREVFGARNAHEFWEGRSYKPIPQATTVRELKRRTDAVDEHARLEDFG